LNATAAYMAAVAASGAKWASEVAEIRFHDEAARAAGVKLETLIRRFGPEFIAARNRFFISCDDAAKASGIESLVVYSTH
jgi:hypothetical protein